MAIVIIYIQLILPHAINNLGLLGVPLLMNKDFFKC